MREEVEPLWEAWIRQVDPLLAGSELLQVVYEALDSRTSLLRRKVAKASPSRSTQTLHCIHTPPFPGRNTG